MRPYVLVLWVSGAAIGYVAARHKGYSPVAGTIAGLIMGPVLAWVLFLIDGIVSPNEMKRCPHCAEWINWAARVCRYCGRDLPRPSGPGRLLHLVFSRGRAAGATTEGGRRPEGV